MKRFVLVAVLAGLLVVAVAGVALAAPPTPGAMGARNGIHTQGTGLMQPNAGSGAGAGQGAGMRQGMPAWSGQPDEVESKLGMTEEQIQAERLAGKSLVQIAATKNVTEQELVSTILTAKQATLDGLVAAGKLTQVQADAIYNHMQTQVSVMVNRTATGPARVQGQGIGSLGAGRMGGRWSR